MENHTSASMYIPSSKVLARLQRHASTSSIPLPSSPAASHPPASPQLPASPTKNRKDKTGRSTSAVLPVVDSTSPSRLPSAAVAAKQVTPYYPSRLPMPRERDTESPAKIHTILPSPLQSIALPPPAQTAALPPASAERAATSIENQSKEQMSKASSLSASAATAENESVMLPAAAVNDATTSAAAPAAMPSIWLLPKDDFTYVFSSLTWNIDLLRLLLPHAPCPLHLPPVEAQVESAQQQQQNTVAASRQAHHAAAAATAPTAKRKVDNQQEEEDAAAGASDNDGADGGKRVMLYASKIDPVRDLNNEEEEDDACTAASGTTTTPLLCKRNSRAGDQSNLLCDEEGSASRSSKPGASAVQHSSHAKSDGQHGSQAEDSVRTDVVKGQWKAKCCVDSPTASSTVTTPTLTWSQYLFRGSTNHQHPHHRNNSSPTVDVNDFGRRTQEQGCLHAASISTTNNDHEHERVPPSPLPGAAAAVTSISSVGLSSTQIDRALLRPASLPSTAAATVTSMHTNNNNHNSNSALAGSNSIFHAHYLPSLEEVQREREAQQQQQSMLSATRLEQHLLHQQQQQHLQHRRRTAANRTFFYSPTPSVASLATTSATSNAPLDDGNEEKTSNVMNTTTNSSVSHNNNNGNALSTSTRWLSYAAAVAASAGAATAAVTPSSRNSPAPSSSTMPSPSREVRRSQSHQQHHIHSSRTSLRLRPRVSSGSSTNNLCAFDDEDDLRSCSAAGSGFNGVTLPTYTLNHDRSSSHNNSNAMPSLSASLCSRLSPQHQQQPSAMMMCAADRLRASIVANVRDMAPSPSPAAHLARHVFQQNTHSTGSTKISTSAIHRRSNKKQKVDAENEYNGSSVSSSSSSSSEGDGVSWLRSRDSNSSSVLHSFPGSPAASISSMSLSKMLCSEVSGRATPHSSNLTAATGNDNSSSFNMRSGNTVNGAHYVRGGGSRRKKKNLRRRKAASTRRHCTIRVYVPSITEGPKAASLYTAPTAEAQELLMQLQHRTYALAGSGLNSHPPTTSKSAASTFYLPSASVLRGAATTQSSGISLASTANNYEHPLTPAVATAAIMSSPLFGSVRSSAFSGNGVKVDNGGGGGGRSGNEQHAIQTSLLHVSTITTGSTGFDTDTSETRTAAPPSSPLPSKSFAQSALTRNYPSAAYPSHINHHSSYLAVARASLSSLSSSVTSLMRLSTQHQNPQQLSPTENAPIPSNPSNDIENNSMKTSPEVWPQSSSPVTSASSAPSSLGRQHDTTHLLNREVSLRGNRNGGEYYDRASLSEIMTEISNDSTTAATSTGAAAAGVMNNTSDAPSTPVELPDWVRERSLSALYYQPWGLELLARYEQQQQQRRHTHQHHRDAAHSRPVVQSSALKRFPNPAVAVATSAHETSPLQHINENCLPSSRASGVGSLCNSLSNLTSPALTPKLPVTSNRSFIAADHHFQSNTSSNSNNNTRPSTPSASSALTPRQPPVLTRPSPSTPHAAATIAATNLVSVASRNSLASPGSTITTNTTANNTAGAVGAVSTPTTLGTPRAPPASTNSIPAPHVSWAEALRQPHQNQGITTTTLSPSSRITATKTMTNATTTTTTPTNVAKSTTPIQYPSALGWPPELSAAEERGAREEAFYFFSGKTLPTLQPMQQQLYANNKNADDSTHCSVGRAKSSVCVSSTEVLASGEVSQQNSNNSDNSSAAPSGRITQQQCGYECWSCDTAHLPPPYLSRQDRARRRLRASQDDATTRSSTARKGTATSAAAELRSKHVSARAAAEAAATGEAATQHTSTATSDERVKTVGIPFSHTAAVTSSDDQFLFGDAHRRKKLAQLYCPPPTATAVNSPSLQQGQEQQQQRSVGNTSEKVHAMLRSSSQAQHSVNSNKHSAVHSKELATALTAEAINPEDQPLFTSEIGSEVVDTDAPTTTAGAATRFLPLPLRPNHKVLSSKHQQQQQPKQVSTLTNNTAPARENSVTAAATATASNENSTSGAAAVSTAASTQQQQQQQHPLPVPEVDINFFLQKFLRAVLIVVITQVRLLQEQQQQRQCAQLETLQRQHASTCPVTAYLLGTHPMFLPLSSNCLPNPHDPTFSNDSNKNTAANNCGAGGVSDQGLTAVERHALAFVRHHMENYKVIITTYVMRDKKEVARRSAQPILVDDDKRDPTNPSTKNSSAAATTLESSSFAPNANQRSAVNEEKCGESNPENCEAACKVDPLFQRRVFTTCLNAARVNSVYEASVNATSANYVVAGTTPTAVDDVAALHTRQLYISGKDAAWQPLLMELLQISRVVQCYNEGPLLPPSTPTAAAAAANSVTTSTTAGTDRNRGTFPTSTSRPSSTPQQHLLASLEKFLAQPTVPLLRSTVAVTSSFTDPSCPPSSEAASSVITPSISASLAPLQAAAAAQMTEQSETFRQYLLTNYLNDPTEVRPSSASNTPGVGAASPSFEVNQGVFEAVPIPVTGAGAASPLRPPSSPPPSYVSSSPAALSSAFTPLLRGHQSEHAFVSSASEPTAKAPRCPSSYQQQPQRQQQHVKLFAPLFQPLTWYPYAYIPGTASPYAESNDPNSTRITPAQAASASAMTLYVAMLPLSGRLIWKWVIPAEDTDIFNLSVFFQSSLFNFMQGGPLPMPTKVYNTPNPNNFIIGTGVASSLPLPPMQQSQTIHASCMWPPLLATSIDARLRRDAVRGAWGDCCPPCACCATHRAGSSHKPSYSTTQLAAAAATLNEEVEETEVTLVHCSAGMHRSCGILVAFLLWLLYQCRQVLIEEQQLGLLSAAQHKLEKPALHAFQIEPQPDQQPTPRSNNEEEEEGREGSLRVCAAGISSSSTRKTGAQDAATVPREGDPLVTSCLLRRSIRHVQQCRSIAVPIGTVQCLLQTFANELRLN